VFPTPEPSSSAFFFGRYFAQKQDKKNLREYLEIYSSLFSGWNRSITTKLRDGITHFGWIIGVSSIFLNVSFILMDVRCFIIPVKIALCIAQKKWKKKPCSHTEGRQNSLSEENFLELENQALTTFF
jgi:hypothetical protein